MLYRVGCLLDAELVAFWALLPLIHRLCAGFANMFIDQNISSGSSFPKSVYPHASDPS